MIKSLVVSALLYSSPVWAKDCSEVAGRAAVRQAVLEIGNGGPARGGINVGPGYMGVYLREPLGAQYATDRNARAWVVVVGDEVGHSTWLVVTSNARCRVLSIARTGLY